VLDDQRNEISAGCESGEFDVADPSRSADFLLHGLHGLLLDALLDGANVSRTAAAAREMHSSIGGSTQLVTPLLMRSVSHSGVSIRL
jgi:hypothetical protein